MIRYLMLWDGPSDDTSGEAYEVHYSDVGLIDREPWCDWLRRHGIDPDDVVVPGWIRRNRTRYRVEYLSIVRDEHGQIVCAEHAERGHARTCSWTDERFVQLEGPPLPFPRAALSASSPPWMRGGET